MLRASGVAIVQQRLVVLMFQELLQLLGSYLNFLHDASVVGSSREASNRCSHLATRISACPHVLAAPRDLSIPSLLART